MLGGLAVSGAAFGLTLQRLLSHGLGPHGTVDLRVYMQAAAAIRAGTTLYGPGFGAHAVHLPFTYPPFAAIALVPVSYIPIGLLKWIWEAALVVILGGCVSIAFRPLLQRLGARVGRRLGSALGVVVITSLALLARPAYDNLVYGQVDIALMAACLFACATPRSRGGRAVLVGLAAAFKVVPGIFVVYLVLTRRWRMAAAAAGAWAAATGLAFVLRPAASVAYYGHLLWKPGRPGAPTSFLNQSVWGMVDRLDLGPLRLPAIALAVGVLALVGLARSVRAWRQGDALAAAVLVGLVGVLASPISWVHETVWLVPAVGVLVGDASRRGRLAAGLAVAAVMLAGLPYVAESHLNLAEWYGRALIDTYGLAAAVLVLVGLRSSCPMVGGIDPYLEPGSLPQDLGQMGKQRSASEPKAYAG